MPKMQKAKEREKREDGRGNRIEEIE